MIHLSLTLTSDADDKRKFKFVLEPAGKLNRRWVIKLITYIPRVDKTLVEFSHEVTRLDMCDQYNASELICLLNQALAGRGQLYGEDKDEDKIEISIQNESQASLFPKAGFRHQGTETGRIPAQDGSAGYETADTNPKASP
jgi:hypothetical protein